MENSRKAELAPSFDTAKSVYRSASSIQRDTSEINILPNELFPQIFSFCSETDILRLGLVQKTFYPLAVTAYRDKIKERVKDYKLLAKLILTHFSKNLSQDDIKRLKTYDTSLTPFFENLAEVKLWSSKPKEYFGRILKQLTQEELSTLKVHFSSQTKHANYFLSLFEEAEKLHLNIQEKVKAINTIPMTLEKYSLSVKLIGQLISNQNYNLAITNLDALVLNNRSGVMNINELASRAIELLLSHSQFEYALKTCRIDSHLTPIIERLVVLGKIEWVFDILNNTKSNSPSNPFQVAFLSISDYFGADELKKAEEVFGSNWNTQIKEMHTLITEYHNNRLHLIETYRQKLTSESSSQEIHQLLQMALNACNFDLAIQLFDLPNYRALKETGIKLTVNKLCRSNTFEKLEEFINKLRTEGFEIDQMPICKEIYLNCIETYLNCGKVKEAAGITSLLNTQEKQDLWNHLCNSLIQRGEVQNAIDLTKSMHPEMTETLELLEKEKSGETWRGKIPENVRQILFDLIPSDYSPAAPRAVS